MTTQAEHAAEILARSLREEGRDPKLRPGMRELIEQMEWFVGAVRDDLKRLDEDLQKKSQGTVVDFGGFGSHYCPISPHRSAAAAPCRMPWHHSCADPSTGERTIAQR
jgi:hypothetical protein